MKNDQEKIQEAIAALKPPGDLTFEEGAGYRRAIADALAIMKNIVTTNTLAT